MNWKLEAAERLEQYPLIQSACRNLPLELQRLRQEASRIKGANRDGVPVKTSGGRYEDRLLENIIRREELNRSLKACKNQLEQTRSALEVLDRDEQLVLQRMYIQPQGNGVERLCRELDLPQASLYRLRERALERFTLAYYGWKESESLS